MPRPKIVHTIETIPFDLIDRNPDQPRRKFNLVKLQELATSIMDNGMAQLPTVRPHPKIPGRYMVNTGERRWRALQMAGITEHQFTVISGDLGSAYDLSVVENRHRVDLDPIEEAIMMKRYFEEGRTMEEVKKVTGYSDFTIYKRIELLGLHPDVQEMVAEGTLPSIRALKLRKIPLAEQIKKAALLVNGTPADFDEDQLQKARRARKVKAKIGSPSEALLGRAMKFAWSSRSTMVHLAELLAMPMEKFSEVTNVINAASRYTLETRFRDLAAISQGLAGRFAAMRCGDKDLRVINKPPESKAPPRVNHFPVVPVETAVVPPKISRPEISFHGASPPDRCSIQGAGRSRAEECRTVLGYLFCGPERHGRVNLSKERLGAVMALPKDRYPEDLALGAIRVMWGSWEMDAKSLQPGPQRDFLLRVAKIREAFGANFAEAMNSIWLQDISNDPVDLTKIVVVTGA